MVGDQPRIPCPALLAGEAVTPFHGRSPLLMLAGLIVSRVTAARGVWRLDSERRRLDAPTERTERFINLSIVLLCSGALLRPTSSDLTGLRTMGAGVAPSSPEE
jgi:hypothetical protein